MTPAPFITRAELEAVAEELSAIDIARASIQAIQAAGCAPNAVPCDPQEAYAMGLITRLQLLELTTTEAPGL